MSSNDDEDLDRDEKPQLSPSAFLHAPSSQVADTDEKLHVSQPLKFEGHEDGRSDTDEPDADELRENRWTGTEETWRQYTADERGLIASLDQQRADDLSVHLYNAHALKKRLYDPVIAAGTQPWQDKSSWMQKDVGGKIPWHPDQNWTAWPHPPSDVPRKEEHFGQEYSDDQIDGYTFRKAAPWRPSGDLREEVQALMLRKAKERFKQRNWADAPGDDPNDVLLTRRISRSQSRRPSTSLSRRGSDASMASTVTDVNSSIAHDLPVTAQPPVFLADDEAAQQLLGQSTRQILSDLDKLFGGLSKSRQGHTRHQPAYGQSNRTHRRRVKAEATKTEGDMDRQAIAGAALSPATDHETDPDLRPATRSGGSSGDHLLGTRDWSEVLGIAALTGWDSAVLDRTTKRCAALFGENVTMRAMPETAAGSAADRVVTYNPDLIPDVSLRDDSTDEDFENFVFSCPVATCPRASQPFELKWRLTEHLKKTHGYAQEDLDQPDHLESASDSSSGEQGTKIESPSSPPTTRTVSRPGHGAVRNDGFLQTVAAVIPWRDNRRSALQRKREDLDGTEPKRKKQKSRQPSAESAGE